MIRTQLKLFPEETKKDQTQKTIRIRQSSSLNIRDWNETVGLIAKNFSTSDRRYYAGMTDGDGHISLRSYSGRSECYKYKTRNGNPGGKRLKKLVMQLQLRHDHAEPILKLGEIFDLTISKVFPLVKKNTQPSLRIEISGMKVKLFLFSIYPYLLEKKEEARAMLRELDCPEEHLPRDRHFSFEYLAGFTDAEGCIVFKLVHEKTKIGNVTSSYKMYYQLSNNDKAQLQFLKKNLIDLGFNHFRKDTTSTYENVKKSKGRNPEKWKPTTHIYLGGTPNQLTKFYKNIEPFILIKHKKDKILATMQYSDIINR
jgi:hypothetical protein